MFLYNYVYVLVLWTDIAYSARLYTFVFYFHVLSPVSNGSAAASASIGVKIDYHDDQAYKAAADSPFCLSDRCHCIVINALR